MLFLLCFLQAVGIFIFIHATTLQLLYLFLVIFGLGYGGTLPLTVALRADLFGRRNYATIAGISMALSVVGTVSAPVLAGYLYDVTQTYTLAFHVFVAMISLSGIIFPPIPRPSPLRKHPHELS